MAFENEHKSRELHVTGLILGVFVCITVIAVTWIVQNGNAPNMESVKLEALYKVVETNAERLSSLEKDLQRLDLRTQHPTGTTEQSRGRAFGSAN